MEYFKVHIDNEEFGLSMDSSMLDSYLKEIESSSREAKRLKKMIAVNEDYLSWAKGDDRYRRTVECSIADMKERLAKQEAVLEDRRSKVKVMKAVQNLVRTRMMLEEMQGRQVSVKVRQAENDCLPLFLLPLSP